MKNIVLITVDCLRKDVVSRQLTPFLWELGEKGAVFENCFSVGSWTLPSFLAIFTSTYPLMFGGELKITSDRTTIAEILQERGYETIGLGFHPFLHSLFGYNAGFDHFFDELEGGWARESDLVRKIADSIFKLIKDKTVLKRFTYYYSLYSLKRNLRTGYKFFLSGEEVNKWAIKTMQKRDKKKPFFCWVHYMDAHFPYLPKTSKFSTQEAHRLNILREKWYRGDKKVERKDLVKLKGLYEKKVSEMDNTLKELFEKLDKEKLIEKSIVVITADHGEEFYEHGEFHHEMNLYDELTHVPLIILEPDLKSQRITRLVSQIDLAPTILDLVGLKKPTAWFGESLFGDKEEKGYAISEEGQKLKGQAMRRNLVFDLNYKKIATRTKDKKYIYNQNGQDELYDLRDDPKEQKNIARQGIPKQLKRILAKHLELIERTNRTKSIK